MNDSVMKYINLVTLLLFVVTTSSNCKKGGLFGDKLPPATREGKNTCGFLVNGKVWITSRGTFDYISVNYDETYNGGTFNINGRKYEKGSNTKYSDFVIALFNLKSEGVYKLNLSSSQVGEYGTSEPYCVYEWSDTIPNHNAFLNVTKLDKQKRIISGTFEFSQIKQNCEEVRITQGRFDMTY
jgi:hypothetical protein